MLKSLFDAHATDLEISRAIDIAAGGPLIDRVAGLMAAQQPAFQIAQTANFRADFSRLATNGACKPTNLLPKYWTTRRNLEISTLALNIAALLISTFLTWRLIKVCPSVGMH